MLIRFSRLSALLLCIIPALPPVFGAPAAPRPNFVVILCDDLGYGDLGSFGHPVIQTPVLDKLAAAGIKFTSAYSAAPVCSPARIGLLTGRNPNRAGIFDWIAEVNHAAAAKASRHLVHLRKQEVTLPALLKEAGSATAMAGKWHGNARFNDPAQTQPHDAGFDHWFATQNNASPSHENPDNYVRNGQPVGRLQGYSCQLAAREAITWLDRLHARQPDQPFFLYVPFHEPHEPVASPPDLVAKYRPLASSEDQAQYYANVENMDRAVGEILAALDRLNLAENTVVFFSSDNGPETLNRYPDAPRSHGSPGALRGMKLWTTEGGFRVPGIIRWPAKISAGKVIDEPMSSLDLVPTFAALGGAKIPVGLKLDGTNIQPLFAGQPLHRPQPLFWVYYSALNEQRVALRDGPWKLLAKLDGGKLPRLQNVTDRTAGAVRDAKLTDYSLYRVNSDLGEARDVSADEPAQLQALSGKMEMLYRELVRTMHVWPAPPLPAGGTP